MSTEAATFALAAAIDKLADSVTQHALGLQAMRQAPAASPPPSGLPPRPAPSNDATREEKMGKKVYAICRQNEWDIAEVGERITGHPMAPNSQKWSFDDLSAVLDQFKEWGFP